MVLRLWEILWIGVATLIAGALLILLGQLAPLAD
jgi:hypothetical protein